jgi:hypothetical protein
MLSEFQLVVHCFLPCSYGTDVSMAYYGRLGIIIWQDWIRRFFMAPIFTTTRRYS